MNKTIVLLMTLTSLAHATQPHEMIIQQVPENSDIIKQCGQQTMFIQSFYNAPQQYHYSIMTNHSMSDADKAREKSNDCTVTIRTHNPCKAKNCQQTVSFPP